MLTDVVEGVSMTFTRNPDYWGFDEKYPDNRLPYIDELTGLIMTEEATIVAGLRSGSIDYIGLPGGGGAFLSSIDQAESLRENNPELVLTAWAYRSENAVQFKMMAPPSMTSKCAPQCKWHWTPNQSTRPTTRGSQTRRRAPGLAML